MATDYLTFCENDLWDAWKENCYLPMPTPFQENALPEPYILFGFGASRLVVLTTNPGQSMPHQLCSALEAGEPISKTDLYGGAALKLGRFYSKELAGRPAGYRIKKMLEISSRLDYDGLMQVELFPFHSKVLPKARKIGLLKEGNTIGAYIKHLKVFLEKRAVVILQAAQTRVSLTCETPESCTYLKAAAGIAGLGLAEVAFRPLIVKNGKTTAGVWVSKGDRKALVLMMGSNNLPGNEGMGKLISALKESWP